jgi:hypothetical protein
MKYGDDALGVECALPASHFGGRYPARLWRRLIHLIARLARVG